MWMRLALLFRKRRESFASAMTDLMVIQQKSKFCLSSFQIMFLVYLYLEQSHINKQINKQNCKKQASKQKTNRLQTFPGNGIQCVNKATGTVAVAPETTVDITASFTRCQPKSVCCSLCLCSCCLKACKCLTCKSL